MRGSGPPRAFTSMSARSDRRRTIVLDVAYVLGILALVALVAAVAKGVERL